MRTAIWALALLVPAVGWAQDAAEVTARMDALYAQRHDAQKLKELTQLTEGALTAHPEDFGVLWRASRHFYWLCDGTPSGAEKQKRGHGERSAQLGQKALEKAPSRVEGHYFAAIGLGCYSQAVGVVTALRQGVEGRFNRWLDKAISIEAGYDNGGPLIAKGRYFFELPWPKRDLGKSREFLQRAVQTKPHAARAHLYLAETQLKDGDAKAAMVSVERALAADEAYDPAEARRSKAWARSLKSQIEEELK